jgi:hypothetical protein
MAETVTEDDVASLKAKFQSFLVDLTDQECAVFTTMVADDPAAGEDGAGATFAWNWQSWFNVRSGSIIGADRSTLVGTSTGTLRW